MSAPEELLSRQIPEPAHAVRYGAHPEQVADVWVPDSTPEAAVLFLHGGFWRDAYDRRHAAPFTHTLTKHGYVAANVEYRRVGGAGGNPCTFDDIVRVEQNLPELVSEACALPANTPVFLAGHSAGGHLALWSSVRHELPAASAWHRQGPAAFDGILALAAVCDVSKALAEGIGDNAAAELLGGLDNLDEIDPARIGPSAMVTALVHGIRDKRVPVGYSIEAADRLAAAGTPYWLESLPEADHFELIDPETRSWQHVLAALKWLTRAHNGATGQK